jgi:hypothetical protein
VRNVPGALRIGIRGERLTRIVVPAPTNRRETSPRTLTWISDSHSGRPSRMFASWTAGSSSRRRGIHRRPSKRARFSTFQ